MLNKVTVLKITKHTIVILSFILGILGFSQILPMPFVIPVLIVLFIIGVVVDCLEMHYKESKSRMNKFSFFLRIGLIIFASIIIIFFVIKKFM